MRDLDLLKWTFFDFCKVVYWCQFHQHFMGTFFVQRCFSLVKFWQKGLLYKKCARKMLMKLTTGEYVGRNDIRQSVNFPNILRGAFLWESDLGSFSLITVWLNHFLAQDNWQKAARWWWNWLQVSISSTFYVRIFCTHVVLAAFFLVTWTLRVRRSYEKRARIKLMKLAAGVSLTSILKAALCKKVFFEAFMWISAAHKVLVKLNTVLPKTLSWSIFKETMAKIVTTQVFFSRLLHALSIQIHSWQPAFQHRSMVCYIKWGLAQRLNNAALELVTELYGCISWHFQLNLATLCPKRVFS